MAEQPHHSMRASASYARSLGITQRATPLASPWTGELRVRFSDFQVNEISEDGSVLHLRTIGRGEKDKPAAEAAVEPTANKANGEAQVEENKQAPSNGAEEVPPTKVEGTREVSPDDVTALEALAGQTFAQELVELYKAGPGKENEARKKITSEPLDDRSKRGQIHQEVRRIFKSQVETTTDDAGAIIASLVPQRKAKNKKKTRATRDKWDEKPAGEYLHFTLFKENRDTMDAVNQIARFLKIKPQSVGYAGTKDRRASTAQRCSVRHLRPQNLAGINGRVWGVTTGDYEYQDKPIHLGQLSGNEFVITIKECKMANESGSEPLADRLQKLQTNVDAALQHMASTGWINYFGHQRFGTHKIGTHDIGKLILGDKYEEAVKSLLHYDEEIATKAENGEIPDEPSRRDEYTRNQACMLFLTGKDVAKAQQILPRRFSAEAAIFRHLDRQGAQSRRDFVGSLVHITRGLRSMYMHAYQSHVWNHAASRRWELHGTKVVEGDLVIEEAEATPLVSGQDQDGDDIINPVPDDDDETPVRARPLSADEAASGRFSVYDVVLPTPGHEVLYPANEIGAFYETFMAKPENGGLDPHKMRRMRREFSLPGRYRKLMNRFLATPSIEVKPYADDTEQMHPTDLDLLKASGAAKGPGGGGAKRPREEAGGESASKKTKVEGEGEGDAAMQGADASSTAKPEDAQATGAVEPTRIAAVVKFQLGRSAYATVALRELMGDPPEEVTE